MANNFVKDTTMASSIPMETSKQDLGKEVLSGIEFD